MSSKILGTEWSRLDEFRRPSAEYVSHHGAVEAAQTGLGQRLFFDPILSRSQRHSCSSCHQPETSWTDHRSRSVGEAHTALAVRTPTLLNVGETLLLGWDGKFQTLESVAFSAISNPALMNLTEAEVVERLARDPRYVEHFAQAFPGEGITRHTVEVALATFQRTIVSGYAPFDRWVDGDASAVSAEAKRGFDLFTGKANCAKCHQGWNFTDGSFHDIGVAKDGDLGRGRLMPNSPHLLHAFKTPTLRNVARRAPYMHDGSFATLDAVIGLYDRGGIARPSRSTLIKPLGLSQAEKADLLAFLETLSDYDPATPDQPSKE